MAETETKNTAQSAEKTQGATGTPAATVASDAQKQVPQSKPAADKPAAEGSTQRNTEEGDKSDKATKIRFFKERQQKRNEKELESLLRENESLKRQLQEREAQARDQQPDTAPSLLDDPDGWEKHKSKEIEDRIISRLTEREREDRLAKESAAAEQYLMTQPHLKDQAFATDVQYLLANDPRLIAIAGSFPQEAAELAYTRACKSRGLDSSANPAQTEAAQRGKGVAPTTPGHSGGGKTWSKGEATKYLDAVPMGSDEWRARLAEVKKAQREGMAP